MVSLRHFEQLLQIFGSERLLSDGQAFWSCKRKHILWFRVFQQRFAVRQKVDCRITRGLTVRCRFGVAVVSPFALETSRCVHGPEVHEPVVGLLHDRVEGRVVCTAVISAEESSGVAVHEIAAGIGADGAGLGEDGGDGIGALCEDGEEGIRSLFRVSTAHQTIRLRRRTYLDEQRERIARPEFRSVEEAPEEEAAVTGDIYGESDGVERARNHNLLSCTWVRDYGTVCGSCRLRIRRTGGAGDLGSSREQLDAVSGDGAEENGRNDEQKNSNAQAGGRNERQRPARWRAVVLLLLLSVGWSRGHWAWAFKTTDDQRSASGLRDRRTAWSGSRSMRGSRGANDGSDRGGRGGLHDYGLVRIRR